MSLNAWTTSIIHTNICQQHQNKFQKLWAFEVFSVIIFVISRLYGHTTGLKLNTKIKTQSQKIKGTVFYYLSFKYSNTKNKFQKLWAFEVFSAIIFVISRLYGHITGLKLNTKMKTKS
jgi:ABC-type Co2+ transport system permease subunit